MQRDARRRTWSAQVNDLVGGWVVTTYPHPLSEHDLRREGGDATRRGYCIADCMTLADALRIADLLNTHGLGFNIPLGFVA